MGDELLIATNNAHKVAEFRRLLGEAGAETQGADTQGADTQVRPHKLVTPAEKGLALDIEEMGATFLDNARLKALAFARASGLPSLADDSGIEVDALDGRPGVQSARYGGPGLTDADRVQLLLREMAGVPAERRTCRYRAVLVLAEPDGNHHYAVEGTCEGRVAFEPAGSNGFGYDPVFLLPERGKTMAQLSPDEKDAISHRGKAARQMARWLANGLPIYQRAR